MRVRLTHFLPGCAAISCLLAAAANAQLAGASPRTGRSIEFSDPKPETEVTNVSRLTRDLNAQLEDQTRPGASASHLETDNSLEGVLPTPIPYAVAAPTAARDRQVRDWMDPNADWTSLTPEDLLREFAVRNILKSPGSEQENGRNRLRSMTETVYERMLDGRSGDASWNSGRDLYSSRPSSRSKTESTFGSKASPSVNEILGVGDDAGLASAGGRPESLIEMLGLNNSSSRIAPGLDRQPDARGGAPQADAYQNLLNGIYETRPAIAAQRPTPTSPWQSGSAAPSASANPFNPYATLPGTVVNPALLPPPPPKAPVPASLAPTPYNPEPEPAYNNMLLRSPTFDATRRPF